LKHFPLIVLLSAILFQAPAALLIQAPARAQLMLPGALQASPSPAGNTGQNPAGTVPGKPKPAGPKPPSEDTILGRDLSRDGFAGTLTFRRDSGKGIEVTRLSLTGEEISHPGGQCRVDVVADEPIQTKFSGKPKGVSRYDVAIAACPFSFEVLDGAVVVSRVPPTCDFPAADCRVAPAGLWGPPGNSFDSGQVKQFERERGLAESMMRAGFRALLKSAGKDKDAIKKIAGEQAGFSSERDVTCRNYVGEEVHGFCALRITQARALALEAAFDESIKLHTKPARTMAKTTAAKQKPAPNPNLDSQQAPPPGSGPQ
jgi:hypothetical protein